MLAVFVGFVVFLEFSFSICGVCVILLGVLDCSTEHEITCSLFSNIMIWGDQPVMIEDDKAVDTDLIENFGFI